MTKSELDSGWFARTIRRKPQNLLWEITNACNLRCRHCESAAGAILPQELNHDQALDLCDQIVAMHWKRVNITGGEPLLRRDWAEIACRLSQGGCTVALITNGLLFNEKTARQAKEAGVTTVAVSLDGLAETHNRIRPTAGKETRSVFAAALAALDTAGQAGLRTVAITQINRWNYGELPEIHSLLTEHGISGWQLQPAVPLGRLREIEEPYLLPVQQLAELEAYCARLIRNHAADKRGLAVAVMHTLGYYGENELVIRGGFHPGRRRFFVGCVGGWRALAVTADGLTKPCAILPRLFAVGDLKQEGLAEVWADRDRFAYQAHWEENKLEGYCARCQYRCLCRAGCTAMAYALTGSIYHNPYCIYGQAKRESGE